MDQFVVCLRASTAGQGRSGLGLGAQRAAVSRYLSGHSGKVLETVTEVEASFHGDRPALARALRRCRSSEATLLVAKLDQLSRDRRFIHGLAARTERTRRTRRRNEELRGVVAKPREAGEALTFAAIAEPLNAAGYRTTRGKFLSRATVHQLLIDGQPARTKEKAP